MSKLNYFQTYSQKENHVTNNTMLMLRHVYRTSPVLFEQLMVSILEDDSLSIGLNFEQQKPTGTQIPDAIISQSPMHIYIEAKHGGELNSGQITRHLKEIEKQKQLNAILVGLTAYPISEMQNQIWKQEAKDKDSRFYSITYDNLIEELGNVCLSEPELSEICQDYQDFIDSEGLRPDQHRHLVALLSGTSYADNAEIGVCYELSTRPPKWRRAHLIGLYHHKQISHVGRIRGVFIATVDEAGVKITETEVGNPSDEIKETIGSAIEAAEKHYPGMGKLPHRFYVTDKFVETNFIKSTSGGLMGHRYLEIGQFSKDVPLAGNTPIEEVAAFLGGKSFE